MNLKLVLQAGGALSMIMVGYTMLEGAIKEFKAEGLAAKAWQEATGEEDVTTEASRIDRGSDRDNGPGVRSVRDDSPEPGTDSRD